MFTYSCPTCMVRLQTAQEVTPDARVQCPKCRTVFVPAREETGAAAPSSAERARPRRWSRDDDDYDEAPRRGPREAHDDDGHPARDDWADDEPPRRRQSRRGSNRLVIGLICGGAALVTVLVVVILIIVLNSASNQ